MIELAKRLAKKQQGACIASFKTPYDMGKIMMHVAGRVMIV